MLLVPRAVDVFLRSCSDKFCSPVQIQLSTSGWCLSFSSSTETGTHSFSLFSVLGCGSTSQRQGRRCASGHAVGVLHEACGRISHIFFVLALFAWFLYVISTTSLYLAALLVLITAGFVILVGRSVVMVSLQGLGKVPLSLS